MKILITGDLVVNRPYEVSLLDQNIVDLFKQSDLNIINLEAPTTTSEAKILKTGPHLKANKESTLVVLKALNTDVITLANNHVLDYDEQGVIDTLQFCQENNIQTVGAGKNLSEASKILFQDTSEGKIAIVNFAENEWASATENSAGANPMDIIDNAKQIQTAKEKADYVIIIVHGGHEYYNLPSPRMQKQYRFYAEQGADVVVGHHTHCISGNEVYQGVPIYYSLGNFLFTKENTNDDWYKGLVLELNIKDGEISSNLHPVKQNKSDWQLELMLEEEKEKLLNRIDEYNMIIKNKVKLKESWEDYVAIKSKSYLNYWSPISFINNKYIKAALLKLGVTLNTRKGNALMLNLMRCEAHADLSRNIMLKYLQK